MKRHAGLSLIEVMVAVVLSAMVLAGALNVVSSVKDSHRLNEALSQSQESGRFALDLLSDAITQSGYYGCLQPLSYTPAAESKLDWTDLSGKFYIKPVAKFPSSNLSQTSLRGFQVKPDGSWLPDPTAAAYNTDMIFLKNLTRPPKKDTDVLNVQFTSSESAVLSEDMASEVADIKINAGLPTIAQFSYLIIGDCAKADLFKVTNQPATVAPIVLKHAATDPNTNTQPNLRNLYTKNTTEVRIFHNDTYYVAATGRVDSLGQSIESLMRLNVNGSTDEIIEGVESLKILYGQQAANGSLKYLSADDTLNTRIVTQIQLTLSIKTLKAAAQKQTSTDGPYLKKSFKRTIQIRNRS